MPGGKVITGASQLTFSNPIRGSRAATAAGCGSRSDPSNVQRRRSTPEVMSNRPSDSVWQWERVVDQRGGFCIHTQRASVAVVDEADDALGAVATEFCLDSPGFLSCDSGEFAGHMRICAIEEQLARARHRDEAYREDPRVARHDDKPGRVRGLRRRGCGARQRQVSTRGDSRAARWPPRD